MKLLRTSSWTLVIVWQLCKLYDKIRFWMPWLSNIFWTFFNQASALSEALIPSKTFLIFAKKQETLLSTRSTLTSRTIEERDGSNNRKHMCEKLERPSLCSRSAAFSAIFKLNNNNFEKKKVKIGSNRSFPLHVSAMWFLLRAITISSTDVNSPQLRRHSSRDCFLSLS